jgi:MFS transporter, DHA3 family, macrolide efflux protein
VFQLFKDPSGPPFFRFWFGQTVSVLGSAVTTFALGFWFFQQTGQATPIYLTALAHLLPRVLLAIPAGVIADRYDRKFLMVISDLFQAVITAIMFALLLANQLELGLVYFLVALKSTIGVLQQVVEPVIITSIVPPALTGQAMGLDSVQYGASNLLGPILGGLLVATVGLPGVFLIDMASFVIGAAMTFTLSLQPEVLSRDEPPSEPGTESNQPKKPKTFFGDAAEGFAWLRTAPGLLGLMFTFGMFNLMMASTSRLVTPLVLSRTGQDAAALGFVAAGFGLGSVLGGLLLTAIGSPKKKAVTVLVTFALAGVVEQLVMGLGRVPWIWVIANFAGGFLLPFYETCNFELYQLKTPKKLLGRVLAVKSMFARAASSLALGTAGVYADRLFEPAMLGPLGGQLQWLLGEGPGRGYALMMLVFGVLTVLVALSGFLRPALMQLEQGIEAEKLDAAQAITDETGAVEIGSVEKGMLEPVVPSISAVPALLEPNLHAPSIHSASLHNSNLHNLSPEHSSPESSGQAKSVPSQPSILGPETAQAIAEFDPYQTLEFVWEFLDPADESGDNGASDEKG